MWQPETLPSEPMARAGTGERQGVAAMRCGSGGTHGDVSPNFVNPYNEGSGVMFQPNLISETVGSEAVTVGYSCPCGCTPSTTYRQHDPVATEGCCCGNEFAVGPEALANVHVRAGYVVHQETVNAPWGELLPVAWAIGPSTHDEPDHTSHGADAHHDDAAEAPKVDPVCGMTVDLGVARAKELTVAHAGVDYAFCGKGCKLDFIDDPSHYLDVSYVPSM